MPLDPFRWTLVALFIAGMTVGVYHRVRARRAGGRVSHREEGAAMYLAIRLSAVVGMGAFLAWFFREERMARSSLPLPDVVRWLGAGLGSFTLWFVYWTMHTLGTNLTDTVVTREKHTLVTGGPYRWVRHPFYLSVPLLSATVTLLTANWFFAVVGAWIFTLLAVRSGKEEAMLLARFGDEYERYRQRTGRFVPRWR